MAGIPKVRIQFDADFDELKKGVNGASNEVEGFSSKVGNFAAKAGAAFALAGAAAVAYAGKLAIDGVKSAIEDEAAQAKLAKTLQNVTEATDAQIASVEKYITETSLATGITDDQLRPSFDRLLRSTQSVTEAINLQSLAIDIAAGTGKGLSQVTEALSKAYDGSFGALKKLGVPIDENIIKTKDFDAAVQTLSTTFAGQADVAANTYAGRFQRMKVAFDEAKETLGFALLPVVEKFSKFLTDDGIPALNAFISGLTGEKGLAVASEYAGKRVDSFEPKISKTQKSAFEAGKDISVMAQAVGKLFSTIDAGTGGEGSAIDGFVKALRALNAVANVTITILRELVFLAQAAAEYLRNPLSTSQGDIDRIRKGLGLKAQQSGFNTSVPSAPSMSQFNTAGFSGGGAVNITVNGAIDSESTARQIVSILNDSQARGTLGGAGILV
jgi:enamine deaminase RidA (YjgF/YER057c/UK114 family)